MNTYERLGISNIIAMKPNFIRNEIRDGPKRRNRNLENCKINCA